MIFLTLSPKKGLLINPLTADFIKDEGFQTVEDFPQFRDEIQMNIIVAGGSNNNYYTVKED
jgi:hypothetical protein